MARVIGLINKVFRGGRGDLPHTMEREFPLLLCKDNRENMRIIEEGGEICSVINFLPRRMAIEGTPILTASIGAVCTHPDYRGRGYSSLILNNVEDRMRALGVRICLISGTRSLYTRWGAGRVKNSVRYRIPSERRELPWRIREYMEGDLPNLKEIYNFQSTRYIREGRDFELLMESGTFPFGDTSYYRYVMEDQEGVRGYIILKRTPEGVTVKEACGKREEIFKSLSYLAHELEIEEINCILPSEVEAPHGYSGKPEYLQGTLKIIDAHGLVEDLRPYFRQCTGEETDSFNIKEAEGGYRLTLSNEVLNISSHDELLKLIFEGGRYKRLHGKLGRFLECVFPLPFPWTENLNYQ